MENLKTTLLFNIEELQQDETIKKNLKKYCNWLLVERKKELKNYKEFYYFKKLLEETTVQNYKDFKERFKKIDRYINFTKFEKLTEKEKEKYLYNSILENTKKNIIKIFDDIIKYLDPTIEELKAITIKTEWKKSQTWGNCPRSEVFVNNRLVASVYSSGCGYCKLSAN